MSQTISQVKYAWQIIEENHPLMKETKLNNALPFIKAWDWTKKKFKKKNTKKQLTQSLLRAGTNQQEPDEVDKYLLLGK